MSLVNRVYVSAVSVGVLLAAACCEARAADRGAPIAPIPAKADGVAPAGPVSGSTAAAGVFTVYLPVIGGNAR